MRRIFTLFAAACAIAALQNVNAQTCNSTTSLTLGTPYTFNSNNQGFAGGDFSWVSNANAMESTPANAGGSTRTLNTVSMTVPLNATEIAVRFDRTGNLNITGYTFNALYNNNGVITPVLLCSGGVLGTNTSITISTTNVPSVLLGRVVRLQLVFNVSGSGGQVIIVDNFATNLSESQIVLPVRISAFDAKKVGAAARLTWRADAEENVEKYEIERSADGRAFTTVGTVAAAGAFAYAFTDLSPLATGFYRVKAVDFDGKISLSGIIKLSANKSGVVLNAFPIPARNNVTLQHGTAAAGSRISLNTQDGRIVRNIVPATGAQQTNVDLSALQPGVYMIRFESGNGEVETLKIVKQ